MAESTMQKEILVRSVRVRCLVQGHLGGPVIELAIFGLPFNPLSLLS